jgi:hypothetical protein
MSKLGRLILAIAFLGLAPWLLFGMKSPALAQAEAQAPELAFQQIVGQPRGLPQLPPSGAWGEVINATTRWIVIQNHSGQQYPISIDDVGEFLVRWPSSLDALTPQSVVEAVGQDIGSNTLQAAHIDVFEGSDRTLVAPTYMSLLPNNAIVTAVDPGFNKFMMGWDYAGQNMLYGWAYPVSPGLQGIPSRLHVVGTAVERFPLRIAIPGNNFAEIVPGNAIQLTVSQVTRGNISYVRKGDYAFLMPTQLNPKGLMLSQLVLYKTLPFRQFNPNVK